MKPFQLLIVDMKSTLRIIQHQVTRGQSLLEKSHNLKFLTSSFGSKKRLCTTIHTLKAIWLKWLFLSILLSYLDSVISVFPQYYIEIGPNITHFLHKNGIFNRLASKWTFFEKKCFARNFTDFQSKISYLQKFPQFSEKYTILIKNKTIYHETIWCC